MSRYENFDQGYIEPGQPYDWMAQRLLSVTRVVAWLGACVSLFLFVAQGFFNGWDATAFATSVVCLGFGLLLYVSYKNRAAANLLIQFYLPTSVMLASVAGKVFNTNPLADFETQYYDYRYFLIVSGLVSAIFFNFWRIRWTGMLPLAYALLLLLLFDPIHNFFGVGYYQTGHTDPSYYFTNLVVLVTFIASVSGIFYLLYQLNKGQQMLRQNVTALKEAKDQAEESDRLKSSFLANLSHEIRTPLQTIIGLTDVLKTTTSPEKQATYLALMELRSYDMLEMLNNLIDMARLETGHWKYEPGILNIEQMFRELVAEFSQRPKVGAGKLVIIKDTKGIVDIEDRQWQGDEGKIKQVLRNLLDNAVRFSNQGGVTLGCSLVDGSLLFSVRDTGKGIAEAMHEVIFLPFRQEDDSIKRVYGGNGLGLAICKRMVELWRGRIWVVSESGKGASFYFTVPQANTKDADHGRANPYDAQFIKTK